MGSQSDMPIMQEAIDILRGFDIEIEVDIVSAHRTPQKMMTYGAEAHKRGLKVIIAGAGGAAHLPGMIASLTPLPVIGVPVKSSNSIDGWDSVLSIQYSALIPLLKQWYQRRVLIGYQIRDSYTPPPMPKLAQPKYTSSNNSARNASAKFSANCVLVGNISEKKDGQGNIIFEGEIKNIGGRRSDFVKVDFVFRKNWSGETKTLTTFVKGSYNTFDTGIVSDASLLPGAVGKFDLYVPQDFGAFIGYSYVIDWEEYQ